MQNKFLRIILDLPPDTKIAILHLEADIEYVNEFITKMIERAYKHHHSNSLIACLGDYDVKHLPFKKIKCRLPKSFSTH